MRFFKNTGRKGRFWTPRDKAWLVICALILALLLAPGIYIGLQIRDYNENVAMGERLDAITDQVWVSGERDVYLVVQEDALYAMQRTADGWQRLDGGRRNPAYLAFRLNGETVFEGDFSLGSDGSITLRPYESQKNNRLTGGQKELVLQPLEEGVVPPWAAR